jgi:hypothetical protein
VSPPRSDIARRRLAAQHLTRAPFADAVDVVRAQGAVQAQDYSAAKWALGMRCRGATDMDVEQVIGSGAILRTHVLRPTWHFVDPADIRWMLSLTAPRVGARMAPYNRQLELDEHTFRRSNDALTRALSGGLHMTRAEVAGLLARERIKLADTRLAHLLMRAELDGVVCSGARKGKQFTYALLDERVPPAAALERDEALAELTKRYFETRGPATPHDFSWWSGLTVGDARRGIQALGTELVHETRDDVTYWSSASAARARAASPLAHLLPNYDEYFIGYRDRGAILERVRAANVSNTPALTAHVLEIDGQVVGGWKRAVKRAVVSIDLSPVIALGAAEREAVVAAAERHAAFLDLPVEIRWAKRPSVRAATKSGWQSGVLR